jgi:hexosaminidase
MRPPIPLLFALCCTSACSAQPSRPSIIPLPKTLVLDSATFAIGGETGIIVGQPELEQEGAFLQAALKPLLGAAPSIIHENRTAGAADPRAVPGTILLLLKKGTALGPEAYELAIGNDHVTLTASTPTGIFFGIQTIVQLLPTISSVGSGAPRVLLPCLSIADEPRFAWRGMHLDVSRHFFPVDFVKKYIDLLARYKMNRFHWHLTDDQGWRIEIKKYPKLTEVGAWRSGSQYGPYSQRTYDSTRYGGFYTQEQIRDVVAYAKARHITVVPEIEMPGHALAALAAYPEMSCTGGPFEVAKGWGVYDDVFCPKEETFIFLENILTEVMDLFPSEYIHVGGDECPKVRWKTCAHCQELMKKEGLKDEGELQSYFIRRIEKFVNDKGRKIIGWDEILEGGLAPNAAVMSWRGTEGGVAAAKQQHDVVMSPGTHCYFDHYQGDPAHEPLAIGGFTTVQKTYSYEPVPDELAAEEAKYIMGAQGNVWTEYITTPDQVEYMALPRMIALAEVLWSPKESRDEASFIRRLEQEFLNLDALRVNYSKSLYNVEFKMSGSKKRGQVNVELTSAPGLGEMHYTIDDSEPTYTSPKFDYTIEQRASTTIKAAIFGGDKKLGNTTSLKLDFDKATGCALNVEPRPDERYDDGGLFTLVDGVSAGEKRVNHEWLGWRTSRVIITADLGSEQALEHAGIGGLEERTSWIHPPKNITIATSSDGQTFTEAANLEADPSAQGRMEFGVELGGRSARYVRFTLNTLPSIPDGSAGAGNLPWLFLDEVHIR